MSKRFELGQLVDTIAVHAKRELDPVFQAFVSDSFLRYINGDWGELSEEDAKLNDEAIDNGERIHGTYKRGDWTIWIITEWDRSVTTILFPEDY